MGDRLTDENKADRRHLEYQPMKFLNIRSDLAANPLNEIEITINHESFQLHNLFRYIILYLIFYEFLILLRAYHADDRKK